MKNNLILDYICLILVISGLSIFIFDVIKTTKIVAPCTSNQVIIGCITTETNGNFSCNCAKKIKIALNNK